ncbi:DUF2946 family protein [Sphingomonas oryzagri]
MGVPFRNVARSVRKLLATLILLLPLAWQSIAIQTHVHPLGTCAVIPAAQTAANSNIATTDGAGHDPALCTLCQELAQAGHLLSSTPPAFHAPAFIATQVIASSFRLWTRHVRSHSWLGRGPPSLS